MAKHIEMYDGLLISTDFGICIKPDSKFQKLSGKSIKAKIERASVLYGFLLDLERIEYVHTMGFGMSKLIRYSYEKDDFVESVLFAIRRINKNPLANNKDKQSAKRILNDYQEYIARQTLQRSPKKTLRKKIIFRDNSKCRYCGITAENKIHIDHVIPYSLGGRTEIENLVVACDKCNLKKSGRTLKEAGMRLLKSSQQ